MIYKRMDSIFRARINRFKLEQEHGGATRADRRSGADLIFAIADRSILQPMYLLALALVVMYGTNTKFPWG
jgi:hypothetical protein